jgi:hypothetical protein
VLCLTSVETAIAAAESLDPDVVRLIDEPRPLHEWVLAASVGTAPTGGDVALSVSE